MSKTAIIIGAGPAGLTAAYELLTRTDIKPVILEKSDIIGGISRTINFKGNRMDMGPHRFFSKSDRVMDWWLKIMPLEDKAAKGATISYQQKSRQVSGADVPGKNQDKVMVVIQRLTRIYFLRKFFAYPLQLSLSMLRTLGWIRTIKILFSFLWIRLFPIKTEKSLEDFIINKFGKHLYLLFFKDYTEKVWGVPCGAISAEWGAQRIKGVSLSKAILQAIKSMQGAKKGSRDLEQKDTETSLIEQFLYPKYGPGSLWEEVARQVLEMGGEVHVNQDVQSIYTVEGEICSIDAINSHTGELTLFRGDYFISSMPVQELIAGIGNSAPKEVQEVAAGLQYRDFINVGILLKQLTDSAGNRLVLKDNWIYIQERDVKVGRVMFYNNWGDGMIQNPDTTWIGMEYFCNKTDELWALGDDAIQNLAIHELEQMQLARVEDVLDCTVRRLEKTYPAYFGTYDRFDIIRAFTDQFSNLFMVGRNGMHKYNNADHSMLTAMVAVDNIVAGSTEKANIWSINTEQEFHEEKMTDKSVKKKTNNWKTFPAFLWRKQWNRVAVILALAVWIVQFILFKIHYPYANYMPDSYSYLEAAYRNLDVNMWPVAYSKFLRFVSVFSHSDIVVTCAQYLFLQGASLLFFFSLTYLIQTGRIIKYIIYGFILLNPIPLYVSNYISADALFIGCSISWSTTLLWILYRPRFWQIPVQAILLLFCFTLRYNAIIYPLLAGLAFLISSFKVRYKLVGFGTACLLVVGSFVYTSNKMQEVTGIRQFSAFGGWQLANNALYMYQNVNSNDRGNVPTKFTKLESMVRQHMDTLAKVKLTYEDTLTTYFYLWSGKGPLIQYMVRQWSNDSTTSYFKRWASVSPLYASYALYLVKKYPLEYFRSFLIPNIKKFSTPPVEFLGTYNMGHDSVGKIAKDWFNYKSQKVTFSDSSKSRIIFTGWYSIFSALTNVLFLLCVIGVVLLYGHGQIHNPFFKALALTSAFWLLNAIFSIVASPVVLRYQLFPIFQCFTISLLAVDFLIKNDQQHE